MNKPLLWLSFIALTVASPVQAGMLGAKVPAAKPEAEPQSSGSASTGTVGSSRATNPNNAQRSSTVIGSQRSAGSATAIDQNTAKMMENMGMTPQEAQAFLEKTKEMNPDELQKYLSSLRQGLEKGTVAPSDIDSSVSADYSPYPAKPQRANDKKTIAQKQNEEAFDELLGEVLPLSPQQIMQLQKFYDLSLQAKATPPTPPPTPHFNSLPVNLEPGSQAPVIRLAAGFVSTLLFVDRTGAPWPITAYSLGDPKNFNIQWDNQSNTMFVQSTKKYVHANMAVRLVGLNTPVMLTLVSGQKNVDFRVDLQLQARGPEAFPAVVEKTPYSTQVNADMINILDGIPPVGSLKLDVHGGPGQAWLFQDKVYYRSKVTLLSPAWMATVSSPDGTHVYEIMPTPYLLASKDGKTINIKLTGL